MLTSRRGDDILKKSWKRIRRIDDLARSPKRGRRICSSGEATELSISGSWSEISKEVASSLSKSVVSLALSNGHTMLFACSGIAVERKGYVTRFVTSATLVRALNDNKKDHDNLKVEVRQEGNVVTGFLGEYNLRHNIAVVNVMTFPDVHFKLFDNLVDFLPCTKIVALGRGISGELVTSIGVLTSNSTEEELMLSTCEISQDCEGGPLFDFDGNFAGMNLLSVDDGTIFMPTRILLSQLALFGSLEEIKFPVPLNLYKARNRVGERLTVEIPDFYQEGEVHKNVITEDQFGDLEALGYPKPSVLNDGMVLVNTFEEPFGDIFGKGVWSELSEAAFSNMRQNVVALASFNGKRRIFTCTGLFIDWNGTTVILTSASLVINSGHGNKIDENLRIEVLLPSQERREGILQHYNPHYNVALVSVKDFCATHPAKIQHLWDDECDLVAVGCCFETGKLMATRGKRIFRYGTLDCRTLAHSTCKITKVGIGGPLIDFGGRFIGMNFYEKNLETPFLLWRRILSVLEDFKAKGTVAELGHAGNPSRVGGAGVGNCIVPLNRWPVPKPYWCHPDDLYKHETTRVGSRGRPQECLLLSL